MPSLTAKREKLVGPLQLALIGVLFAVSFFYLLPKQEAFTIEEAGSSNRDAPVIGELDLAYLKARSASGETETAETTRAVVALIKTGQIDTARELMEKQPDVAIGERERFSLDLELASVEYYSAQTDRDRSAKRLQLLNRIDLLLKQPQLRNLAHLTRATELTEQLDKPDTAIALYSLLAAEDKNNASYWFAKCARTNAAEKQYKQSFACFDKAIAAATTSDDVFALRLEQLDQASAGSNKMQQDFIVHLLSAHQPLNNQQREDLAVTMLAHQRPDKAYEVYAELARNDKPKQVHWYQEAAKWAQASNEPGKAATYLDEAASVSTGSVKVDLLERAEKLLIAAGENEEAFKRLALRIDEHPSDESLLRVGIKLARQLGKNAQAAQWNRQLLNVNPTDIDAVNTQVKLALASGDLSGAAQWARHAAGIKPNSKEERVRLAQVLEWTGDPVGAQREWQWVATHHPDTDNITQLVRLAELNRETDIAAASLHKLLLLTPTDDEKIERLVKLYELEGKPLAAASLLNELQATSGVRAYTQRELARLYQRHILYPESLSAWELYAKRFGRGSEETLNRLELLWRLNKPKAAAEVAKYLVGRSNVSDATKNQVLLVSEIAWRYRLPELAALVKPHLSEIEDKQESIMLGKRIVQSLEDAGKDQEAITEATRLWQTTQSADVAFTAMNLAFRTGNTNSAESFLAQTEENAKLQESPDYWNLAASIHQKNGSRAAAKSAYEQALVLDKRNTGALSGLLWLLIDTQNTDAIAQFIVQYEEVAQTTPELWSPFAIGYLQLGMPEESLTWFDRQIERIDADYNMLLTFADALEYAGRAEPARKVRLYAIRKLRPVLAEGSVDDQDSLLRQYAQLLNLYGSAEDKERVAELMLRTSTDQAEQKRFWREDIAISWLMATQRHEHARIVMAKLHHQRLAAPAWQDLSLAMAANDLSRIQQVLNGTGSVSVGNHILALRKLGDDQGAYALAKHASLRAPSLSDREIARGQYQAMRSERPRFTSGKHRQTSISNLAINETGLTIRHSLDSMNLGFGIDYTQRLFSSDVYMLNNIAEQSDVALTLFHGDRRFGGKITTGFNSNDTDSLVYALTQHHKPLSAELAFNEAATASALLRVAAKQNRATLGYEQNLGHREFVKLQADVSDISTRVQERRIARGLQARVEFGIRGAFGSNVWSTSFVANRAENDVASQLPSELNLAPGTTINSILTDSSTTLSFGASLSRGGIQGDYPQASSPRYYLNANVARSWPDASIGLQLDGGAGIRVLGGDELSIGFAHDTQPSSKAGTENDTTSIGVNYRYHF